MTSRSAGRRRPVLWPLVAAVLVLILALIVAADRFLDGRAEQEVAARLQTELPTSSPPEVHIDGFPFLTQAVLRRFGSVRVGADDVQAPDGDVAVQRLDLTLRDVTTADWFRTFTAGTVDGTARLTYEAAGALVGHPVTYVPDGRIRLQTSQRVGVLEADVILEARPAVDVQAQTLRFEDPAVTLNGTAVPQSVADSLISSLVPPQPITGVPLDLDITGLQADEAGLTVTLTGTDVPVSR